MVVRIIESKKSPIKTAEKIKQMIAALDSALQSVGGMPRELWCQLYEIQLEIDKVTELLKSYEEK